MIDAITLKRLRKWKGLSLRELGRKSGLSHTTLLKIEDGRVTDLKTDNVIKLAKVFDCPPSFLIIKRPNT